MATDERSVFKVDPGSHNGTITDLIVAYGGIAFTAGEDKRVRAWMKGEDEVDGFAINGRVGPGDDGAIQAIAACKTKELLVVAAHSEPAGGTVVRFIVFDPNIVVRAIRWSRPIADMAFTDDGARLVVATEASVATEADHEDGLFGGRLEVHSLETLLPDEVYQTSVKDAMQLTDWTEPVDSIGLRNTPAKLALGPPMTDGGDQLTAVSPKAVENIELVMLSQDGFAERPVPADEDRAPVGRSAALAISEDYVVAVGEDTGVTIFDHSGIVLRQATAGAGGDQPAGVAVSPSGHLLAIGSRAGADSEVTVHDLRDNLATVGSRRYDGSVLAVRFVDDYELVCAGGSRFSIHFWRAETHDADGGDWIRHSPGQTIDAVGISGSHIGYGTLDPGRTDLMWQAERPLIRRFDLETLSLVSAKQELNQEVPIADFIRAVEEDQTGENRLELVNSELILQPDERVLGSQLGPPQSRATCWGMMPAGGVLVGLRSGLIQALRHVDGAAYGGELIGHDASVLDVAVGERWIITGGADQVIHLWSRPEVEVLLARPVSEGATLRPALSKFVTAGGEWVVWSKSGYFVSSRLGDRNIAFHENRGDAAMARSYGADLFGKHLYRPDVIERIVDHGSEERALQALAIEPLAIAEALPPLVTTRARVAETSQWEDYSTEEAYDLEFDVTEATSPTSRIWILQDGVYVADIDPSSGVSQDAEIGPGTTRTYQELVFLQPGMNKLEIVAENDTAKAIPAPFRVVYEPAVDQPAVPVAGDVSFVIPIEEPSSAGVASVMYFEHFEYQPARARIDSAELVLRLKLDEGAETTHLIAHQNQLEMLRYEIDQHSQFDGQIRLPLWEGSNRLALSALEANEGADLLSVDFVLEPQQTDGFRPVPDDDTTDSTGQGGVDEKQLYSEHVVSPGETLRSIAEYHYGDRDLYWQILDANTSVYDPDQLEAGTTLLIPILGLPDDAADDEWENELGAEFGDEADDKEGEDQKEVEDTIPRREASSSGPAIPLPEDGGPAETDPDPLMSDPMSTGPAEEPPVLVVVSEGDNGTSSTGAVFDPAGTKGAGDDEPPVPPSTIGKRNLYMLAIGVGALEHADQGFKPLKWAEDDAIAIANRFKACEGGEFGQVHQVGFGGRNVVAGEHATKANIEQAVKDLVALVKAREAEKKATRDSTVDMTVLFISSHGMARVPSPGKPEGLYLVPYDYEDPLGDERRWQDTSVALVDLGRDLCRIPRTELAVFLDACRAGSAGSDIVRSINPEHFDNQMKAISPSTIYLLNSTEANLNSREGRFYHPEKVRGKKKGHGLFTHALLFLMDQADRDGEVITMAHLIASIEKKFYGWSQQTWWRRSKILQSPTFQVHKSQRRSTIYRAKQ